MKKVQVIEALEILKENGYKYTGKREEMIRIFDREKRYMSAKEMLERMQKIYPDVSFDTIYRNMTLFEELNILECTELSGERRFRIRCSTKDHHHHFICLTCGKTKQIHACPMESIQAEADGFMITDHKFEIYGYCRTCQEDRHEMVQGL